MLKNKHLKLWSKLWRTRPLNEQPGPEHLRPMARVSKYFGPGPKYSYLPSASQLGNLLTFLIFDTNGHEKKSNFYFFKTHNFPDQLIYNIFPTIRQIYNIFPIIRHIYNIFQNSTTQYPYLQHIPKIYNISLLLKHNTLFLLEYKETKVGYLGVIL